MELLAHIYKNSGSLIKVRNYKGFYFELLGSQECNVICDFEVDATVEVTGASYAIDNGKTFIKSSKGKSIEITRNSSYCRVKESKDILSDDTKWKSTDVQTFIL